MILTATRVRETLDARWEEIDWDTATWTIPPARMKMNVAHVIPLSTGAIAVLKKQQAIRAERPRVHGPLRLLDVLVAYRPRAQAPRRRLHAPRVEKRLPRCYGGCAGR